MPVQNHRFPLRRQIVWGMRLFTAIVSLAVGLALLLAIQPDIAGQHPAVAEFNLRLTPRPTVQSGQRRCLLNWAAVDSTHRLYLDRSELTGAQTMTAYKAAQEKYLSSPLQTRILRFFITDEQDRFLQFGKPLPNSMALDRASVQLFLSRGYGMGPVGGPSFAGASPGAGAQPPHPCPRGGRASGHRCIWGFLPRSSQPRPPGMPWTRAVRCTGRWTAGCGRSKRGSWWDRRTCSARWNFTG